MKLEVLLVLLVLFSVFVGGVRLSVQAHSFMPYIWPFSEAMLSRALLIGLDKVHSSIPICKVNNNLIHLASFRLKSCSGRGRLRSPR